MATPKKRKPILRVYFDCETYIHKQEDPIDYPEVTCIKAKTPELDGTERTFPRVVVNTSVYAIGGTYVKGVIQAPKANNPDCIVDCEGEEQYATIDIPEGYQVYKHSLGPNCIIEFIEDIFPWTATHHVQLGAYNTTFDFHQIIWDIRDYFEKNTDAKVKIESVLGDDTQIKGIFSVKFKKERIKRTFEFKDLGQFHKSKGLKSGFKDLGRLHGIRVEKKAIEYAKYDLQFDSNGIPTIYSRREITLDGVKGYSEEFDHIRELEYLRTDVIYLPIIRKEIELFKREVVDSIFEGGLDCRRPGGQLRKRLEIAVLRSTTEGGFTKRLQDTMLRQVFGKDPRLSELIPDLEAYAMNPMSNRQKTSESLYDRLFRPACDQEDIEPQLASYFGGFVSGNQYISKYKGFSILIDVNSMYPGVMNDFMPYGELLDEVPFCHKSHDPILDESYCTGYKVVGQGVPEGKKKYDFMDTQILGKCFFKKAYFTARHESYGGCLKEYGDLMKEMCNIDHLRIEETYYMRTRRLMRPYIEKLVEVKKRYTPTKDGVGQRKYIGAKIMANSVYGKLAEKPHYDTEEYDGEQRQYFLRDGVEYRCLYAGMYVTIMSRVKLIGTIKQLVDAGNTFLYCDTDSILVGLTGDYSFIDVHPTRLGAWDVEKVFNKFVYSGKRKKYCIEYDKEQDCEEIYNKFQTWYKSLVPDVSDGEKKLTRKGTTSGFAIEIAHDLKDWKDIETLYDPEINVFIVNAKKVAKKDSYTYKKFFEHTNSEFNRGVEISKYYLQQNTEGKWELHVKKTPDQRD